MQGTDIQRAPPKKTTKKKENEVLLCFELCWVEGRAKLELTSFR